MKRLFFCFCIILFVQLFVPAFAQLQKDLRYSYQVTIGKKIEAELWLTEVDKVVFGEIRYKKGKTPIALRGEQSSGEYRILEFDSTGMISGIITGAITPSAAIGKWFSPQTRAVLPIKFRLKQKTVLPASLRPKREFSGGIYTFQYGTEGYLGHLSVQRLEKDSVLLEINNVTGAPSHNLANVDPVMVPIRNNEILYALDKECEFRIRFFNGLAVVNYVSGKSDCAFGMSASVDGIYWLNR